MKLHFIRGGLISTVWTEELLASSRCDTRGKQLWVHYPYQDSHSRKYFCVVWWEEGRHYRRVHKELEPAKIAYNAIGEMNVPDKAEH